MWVVAYVGPCVSVMNWAHAPAGAADPATGIAAPAASTMAATAALILFLTCSPPAGASRHGSLAAWKLSHPLSVGQPHGRVGTWAVGSGGSSTLRYPAPIELGR